MYSCSRHYKDACEVGKVEYAAAYRTLLMLVDAKQRGVTLPDKLMEAGWDNVILAGAGDLCGIFIREMQNSPVKIRGIIENDKKKYGKFFCGYPLYSFADITPDFNKGEKVIICYMNKSNEWIKVLRGKGIVMNHIITMEELVAYILLKE